MNGKKVLVTGGFGNLGSYIVKHLINLNYEVTILTRREKYKFDNLKYKVVECDITNLEELKSKLNYGFDFCVHCASFNEFFVENYSKKALEINSLGTRNLLEVLNLKNLKNFIYFSTFHVYGLNSGFIDEMTVANPKNDYASTHLFAEYYIKQFGYTHNLKYTILRLTNSYGCPMYKDTDKWYLVLNDLVKMAFEKNKIVLNSNGKVKRDFIYMGDVANIVGELLEIDATNQIYNLSSNQSYEVIELAKKVKKIFENRYNESIEIQINQNDLTKYYELFVENKKLKFLINFETYNNLDDEIENIFELLEKK
ncbi:NAD-dependent epimerase/dehydratase family protein [Aliarcobacter butzleri]|uniref:NAD-dependent epimerase/dehydratase family protein n=1 Tax=Aliarcobacter butzleri TaxID=28197 RepID=UPI00263C8A7B|nr:NAD(P)-dependent oxidoreductase [Aliarcobacter butzleri]MDN5067886.1 NAD(P)-dependent oxidoreductase [Aliarcobacter butzleri]MDN5072712.1 NAD(P)-dependent oxidoreductase [Aliarcobacter butzleri]MDN5121690.1 NAD(P)-dependent oxidoreductase [Aliarcobacter butzleri]